MANILTSIRIICGFMILFFPTFSNEYYLLYFLGGFSDAIDGTVARKFGKESDFGAKFDTLADMIFLLSATFTIIRINVIPLWLLIWTGIVVIIKSASLLIGFLRFHRFVAVHSKINKLCGVAVFFAPIIIGNGFEWNVKLLLLTFMCMLASVAAICEFVFILRKKPM